MNIFSDNSILFLLAVGACLTFFIAVKPTLLLWFSTMFTLIVAGSVGYFIPSLKVVQWISYGGAVLMYVPAALALTKKRPKQFSLLPACIIIFTSLFIATSFISSIASNVPLSQIIVASKSLFLIGGVWAFLATTSLPDKIMIRWLKGLLVIGIIQIIPVMYQFLFIRSWRVAHTRFQVESADAVAGTFGGSQTAGGLGAVLVFYLFVCIIVLLAMSKLKGFSWKKNWWIFLALGLPILLTEVKAIFFYLPVGIFFLYRKYIYQRPIMFTIGSFVICLVMIGMLFSLQTIHLTFRGDDWRSNLQKAFNYSFQTQSQSGRITGSRLSRLGVLQFWWQEHGTDNITYTLIGHGLGSSRTQGQVLGTEALHYGGRKIDLTGLSSLLWEVGLVGVALLSSILAALFFLADKLSRSQKLSGWQKALASGLQATILLIALSIFYRNDIPYAAPMMFTVMTIFGLIGWLNKQDIGTLASDGA